MLWEIDSLHFDWSSIEELLRAADQMYSYAISKCEIRKPASQALCLTSLPGWQMEALLAPITSYSFGVIMKAISLQERVYTEQLAIVALHFEKTQCWKAC